MSDAFTAPTFTAPEPAAAPAAEPTPAASPASDAAAGAAPQAPAINPVWERAIAHIPEAWRAPIIAEFQNVDREAQKAIEAARANSTPSEWKALVDQATKAGLTPDEFIDAYNGQLDLQERVQADPDAFLNELKTFVEGEISAGRLTRKQGAAAIQQANAAAEEDPDLFETPEAKRLAALEQREQEREQRAKQEAEQRVEQERQQEAEKYATTFLSELNDVMVQNGFTTLDAAGQPQYAVPLPLQHQIALTADSLLDADASLSPRAAIEKATQAFRQQMQAVGAQLPQAPGQAPARQQIPVLGGGTGGQVAPAAPEKLTGDARNDEILRVMREMQGQ